MKRIVIAFFAAALALVSCSKRVDLPQQENDLTVRFTTEQLNKFNFKSALEANDKVGVFAGTPISGTNVLYTATADKRLTSQTPLKWIKDNAEPVDFTAYRPYDEALATTVIDFAVKADQRNVTDYDASDLMAATATAVEPGTVVPLTFKHMLSKVSVKLTNNVTDASVTAVSIEGVALGATVDLVSGGVSGVTARTSVKSLPVTADQYDAIIIPQTARPMIVVSLSNGLAYKYLLTADAHFDPGKVAVANLTVNPGTPSEEDVVAFTFTVLDWEEGAELATEEPIIVEEAGTVWKVVGLGDNWDYASGIAMTETDGIWEADVTLTAEDEFKLWNGEIWAGMKDNWLYYAPGDYEDGYLDGTDAGKNILVKTDSNTPVVGKVHLAFNAETFRFIVTVVTDDTPSVDPVTTNVWKVVGLGGDWTWENGIVMTETDGVWEADVTLIAGDEFKLNLNEGETWAGMKSGWTFYAPGSFDDGYLETPGNNIVVKTDADTPVTGQIHLAFTAETYRFIITVPDVTPEP